MNLTDKLPTSVNCPLCHDMAKRMGGVFDCTSCGIRLRPTRIRSWLKWLDTWGSDNDSKGAGDDL